MAASIFLFDRQKDLMRDSVRALGLIREGMLLLEATRGVWIQSRDGDGSQDAHYDLTASLGGFLAGDYTTANAAARASFLELDSLYSKIATNATVSDVRTAIEQACAKHSVTQG